MTEIKLPEPLATSPRQALATVMEETLRDLFMERARLTQVLAGRLEIPPADLECLELAYLRGGVTVGELAAAKGVTPGAVSQSLNRLEAKDMTRREPDPADRRRTIVRA